MSNATELDESVRIHDNAKETLMGGRIFYCHCRCGWRACIFIFSPAYNLYVVKKHRQGSFRQRNAYKSPYVYYNSWSKLDRPYWSGRAACSLFRTVLKRVGWSVNIPIQRWHFGPLDQSKRQFARQYHIMHACLMTLLGVPTISRCRLASSSFVLLWIIW